MYGGDATHLPSRSATTRITFQDFMFSIAPSMVTVATGGMQQFTATGGAVPIRWFVSYDQQCAINNVCSQIDEKSGAFTAATAAGYVIVQALDTDGADAYAYVTVGAPGYPPPWNPDAGVPVVDSGAGDAGSTQDGGALAEAGGDAASAGDSGPTNPVEASADAAEEGASKPGTLTGGCACTAAGRRGRRLDGGAHHEGSTGALGALVLGLGALFARRRRALHA